MDRNLGRTVRWGDWAEWWWSWRKQPRVGKDSRWDSLLKAREDGSGTREWTVVVARDAEFRRTGTSIAHRDFGAGAPEEGHGSHVSLARLARTAASDGRKGKWLMAAVRAVSRRRRNVAILELGTCLGSGGDFMLGAALEGARYCGLEGSSGLAGITRARLGRHVLKGKGVEVIEGPFSMTLPSVLEGSSGFDVVFLDGCHEGQALVGQWEQIRPHVREGGLVVVDDIRWSRDMHAAWLELAGRPGVEALDLFRMGVLRPGGQAMQGGIRRSTFASRA